MVVAIALALSLFPSFLAFGLFQWFCFRRKDGHVVQCVVVGSDGRGEDVQRCTVFGVKRGLEVFG